MAVGVSVRSGANLTVSDCSFAGFDIAIEAHEPASLNVNLFQFNDCKEAIYARNANNVNLTANTIDGRAVPDVRGDFRILSLIDEKTIVAAALEIANAPPKRRKKVLMSSALGKWLKSQNFKEWRELIAWLLVVANGIKNLFF